jgi:hypothetical protein
MLIREGPSALRFTRVFAMVALLIVLVLVGIEATGLCPLVH